MLNLLELARVVFLCASNSLDAFRKPIGSVCVIDLLIESYKKKSDVA